MTDVILHHFNLSPFAEKIRVLFGVKKMRWRSVQIPMVMPKPKLTALTGGYRKTPAMQIGADIYCDTMLIAQTVERLFPDPPVFRAGALAETGLQAWSDSAFFPPGAALSLYENAAHIPDAVSKDREDYFTSLNFKAFAQDAPHFRSQFRAHARLIDDQLADGRSFLFGAYPSWSDIGAYFNIWMAGGNIPSAERMLADFTRLQDWRARMAAFGESVRTEISAEDALDIARDAAPHQPLIGEAVNDESGAAIGDRVTVTPDDHGKEPVAGALAAVSDHEIIIHRNTPRTGEVAVHFPRIGYRIDLDG